MIARTDLAPIPLRGPKAPLLFGPMAGVLRFFADPISRMFALHREYGDIVPVVDGNAAMVCAFGAELNRAVITQPALFEHISEVPIRVPPGTAFARFNNTILFMNGETHRRRRRLLAPAFSKTAVDGYAPEMAAVADEHVARWAIGAVTDVSKLLRELAASIALRCLLGLKTSAETEELSRLEIDILATIASPLIMLLPFDLPGTPLRHTLRLAERLEPRIRRLIDEKRKSPGGSDALSRLIAARDDDGASLSDDDLLGECNSLFTAGFDTSAHTLNWTLLLLAQHPDVLDELMEEIHSILKGAPPGIEHLPSLVRLDRVVKESMRLLTAPVLLYMRVCAADTPLGPCTLPRGAQVILSPMVTHRDPSLYPSPQRFDPARWEKLDPPPYSYLPFGVGSRMCIGAAFATVALRLALARILQSVRPVIPPNTKVDYAVRGPAMGPKKGLRLELAPAASSKRSARVTGTITRLVDFPAELT